jgi:hypothetical protein
LSSDGNPEFSTVLKVIKALGLTLHATAWPTTPLFMIHFENNLTALASLNRYIRLALKTGGKL